ncbi:MAG: tetratricopeptide repeat protein [Bacteroidota bacterium]
MGILGLYSLPILSQTPALSLRPPVIEGTNYSSSSGLATRLYLDGLVALEDESYEEALALLLESEKNSTTQSGISYAISHAYFGLNEIDNALYYAQEALSAEPLNSWYRLHYAHIRLAQGYYQETVKEIELVLTNEPRHRDALIALVDAHTKMGFLTEANTVIHDRILAQHATYPQPFNHDWETRRWYEQLYRNYESLGDQESVQQILMEWSEKYPFDEQLLRLLSQQSSSDENKPRTNSAVQPLTDEIVIRSGSPEGFTNARDAIEWLHQLIHLQTGHSQTLHLDLELYGKLPSDFVHEILNYASLLNDRFPEQGEILSLMGEMYIQQGDVNQAKRYFSGAVKSPGSRQEKSEWYRKLGELEAADNEMESALRSFSLSTRYDSNNAMAWASHAVTLVSANSEDAQANEFMEKALELHSDHPLIMEKYGDYYEAMGRYEQATIWWQKALKTGGRADILKQKMVKYGN